MVFSSKEGQIKGLLEFIRENGCGFSDLIIFDTKVGNAVALLSVYLSTKEVFGVLGSERAKDTLERLNIDYYFEKTIPEMLNKAGTDICPLEKLSLFKNPEEFYNLVKNR